METILVAGVESIVGANLAASLSDRRRVVGLTLHTQAPVSVAGCETRPGPAEQSEAIRQCVAALRPARIVYCGPAAWSCWQTAGAPAVGAQSIEAAAHWARAAAEFGCPLTLVSSDAVFTGPWMFHTETSDSHCPSPQATTIRTIEQRVAEICPSALIVRTSAYGWSPLAGGGWIERLLGELESGTAGPFDYVRHGTPILATDLVEILVRAWDEGLDGVYHIAGGERANPCRFVAQLADEFDLQAPLRPRAESLTDRASGFGCGETSLHTKKIRLALCVAMPTLAEGLRRLREQSENGWRDKLSGAPLVHDRVA